VLAAALAAKADLIVSGDAHLLDLKSFQGIKIVTAAVAVERIAPGAYNNARAGRVFGTGVRQRRAISASQRLPKESRLAVRE
jgi:hypothetical protein